MHNRNEYQRVCIGLRIHHSVGSAFLFREIVLANCSVSYLVVCFAEHVGDALHDIVLVSLHSFRCCVGEVLDVAHILVLFPAWFVWSLMVKILHV